MNRSSLRAPFEQPASQTNTTLSSDNIIVELATEHYEIARYIEIITAATNVGDLVTVRMCEGILEDEEAMAEKLIVELPEITSTYLELFFLSERWKLRRRKSSRLRTNQRR